jgi:hypothetical protein
MDGLAARLVLRSIQTHPALDGHAVIDSSFLCEYQRGNAVIAQLLAASDCGLPALLEFRRRHLLAPRRAADVRRSGMHLQQLPQ